MPKKIKEVLSLAYLLARITDTVSDTQNIPASLRIQLLNQIHDRLFLNKAIDPIIYNDFIALQQKPEEKELLLHLDDCAQWFYELKNIDQDMMRNLLKTIIAGQRWDLEFFGEKKTKIRIIESPQELESYTYFVAGCVGEYWTKVCQHFLNSYSSDSSPLLLEQSIQFGKGLQLVNILRDIPNDLQLGRCYLPLKPANLDIKLDEQLELLEHFRLMAIEKLADGFKYIQKLHIRRIRLACYLPLFIGLKTLMQLKNFNYLKHPKNPVKISRTEIYKILLLSIGACFKRSLAEWLFKNWYKQAI
jgi:farnesyl-diphosphate farnesyltransferase